MFVTNTQVKRIYPSLDYYLSGVPICGKKK